MRKTTKTTEKVKYKHWQTRIDEKGVFWAGFDRQDSTVNTINEEVLAELNVILDGIIRNVIVLSAASDAINDFAVVRGMIIYSAKEKGFIAGADIHIFESLDSCDVPKVEQLLTLGQTVFDKLATLSVPTVAMIHGFCLGGGAELALACRYRILIDRNDTCIGFPEVLLGIIPGWGGIKRLPSLIGSYRALTRLLLTGKNIYAKDALRWGLVDAIVPERIGKITASVFALKTNKKEKKSNTIIIEKIIRIPFVQSLFSWMIRKRLNQRINPVHYPAPYEILNAWEKKLSSTEIIESIKTLVFATGSTAKQLLRVFNLRERLKKRVDLKEKEVNHIHVAGAGTMGVDIAAWCVFKGLKVTLHDANPEALGRAISRAVQYFKKQSHSASTFRSMCDRLIPDFHGKGVAQADVIIEAIVEKLNVKQDFFREVEKKAKPEALLMTNTSSLSVQAIAEVLVSPARLMGVHFFNPATKMELVEVIYAAENLRTQQCIDLFSQTLAFVSKIGKLPILVKNSPGFLINRLLMTYLIACMNLLNEGETAASIDQAVLSWGMMMGPFEMADTVGLDICLTVAQNLHAQIPEKLMEMVSLGFLGKKMQKGFFVYDRQGKKKTFTLIKEVNKMDLQVKVANVMTQMVNEAEKCLSEGIVADADLLDAAMIFGAGFAPFRGGPMHYARSLIKY